MRISDWSSDVCSSDLLVSTRVSTAAAGIRRKLSWRWTGLEFCDLFSQLCCESAPDSCSLRRIFLHLAKLPLKIGRRNHVSQPIAVFTNDLHEVACALRRKELFALQNGEFTLFQLLEYVLPSSLSSEAAVGPEIANLCIVIQIGRAHV